MLPRIARVLWKIIKWTVLVTVALFALAVLINLRDEPLSDEARALLETKPVNVPDNENIFVAMAGFNAPEGEDIFEFGRKRIEEIEKELAKDPSGFRMILRGEKEKNEGELRWKKTEPPFDCLSGKETDLLECAHLQKERLEKTLAANETLVRRYRLSRELPHYTAPQNPHAWFFLGSFSGSLTQGALKAQALLDIESGNAEEGWAFFKKDMVFWRQILKGKNYLIDTMAATGRMTSEVYRLSLLLSSPTVDVEKYAMEWRELLMPLSPEQAHMRPALEGEIRSIYSLSQAYKKWTSFQEAAELKQEYRYCWLWEFGKCSSWRWWLEQNGQNLFFQPNATFNYAVPFHKTWLKLTNLSRKDYMEQRDDSFASLSELSEPGIRWVYNPYGKWMASRNSLIDYGFVETLHDLDAYLRLVRLQLELRLAKIPSEEIPAFIEQLDEAYCSPCSDFSWDAETRMLSFQPYHEKSFTRHASASVYVPEVGVEKR
ncbi:MAG: hypothetical protein LBE75_07890 [Burkholderiales bacterium]|nr:hypothetical protein [Burkholderiales bacterium]